jgi:ABC-type sulfate/molybdate transport systems ATPase subunit
MGTGEPLVRLRGVSKDYRALRPLRIAQLDLQPGDSVALLGLDHAAAEVLVNIITGAMLPDAGEVVVMGRLTTAIADADAWLGVLDQFGLVSERAVLLDQMTVEQNMAIPFSLQLEPPPSEVRNRVSALAEEVGLESVDLGRRLSELPPPRRLRVRLGRALALNPRVLLAEHPNASLSTDEVAPFAADLSRVVAARGLAAITITADATFASAVAEHVLTLEPATGELKRRAGWRRWFAPSR